MTIVAVNGGGNTPNETREGADTTDQDFALVIHNGTAGASWDTEPITFTASVSGGSGPSGPEDSFVIDNDASTVSARPAMLNMWTANFCGSGSADDSVHLLGTSDAFAPTDFFLI